MSFKEFITKNYKKSYAQCGEDLIVDFIMNALNISHPFYLDIGTNHPIKMNNTYLFYQRDCRGVCVEPDPMLCTIISKKRKRDTCLNVGVGVTEESEIPFYVISTKTLSTFSKEDAERYQAYGNQKIEQVIQIPLVPVNHIIEKYFRGVPNFVSLDTEGMDLMILETFDFLRFRPEVFCVETLTYTEDKRERKLTEIIDFIVSKDYFVFADTFINSIFVDNKVWQNRSV